MRPQFENLTSQEWTFMVQAKNPIVKCQKCGRPGTQIVSLTNRTKGEYDLRINHAGSKATAKDSYKRSPCYMGKVLSDGQMMQKFDQQDEQQKKKAELTATLLPKRQGEQVDYERVVKDLIQVLARHKLVALPQAAADHDEAETETETQAKKPGAGLETSDPGSSEWTDGVPFRKTEQPEAKAAQ